MIKTFYVCGVRFAFRDAWRGVPYTNGPSGSVWDVYVLNGNAWLFSGRGFLPGLKPTRSKVIAMFEDNPAVYAAMKPVGDEHDI
jgi:hypothetical protein